jgi:hypothetical protein
MLWKGSRRARTSALAGGLAVLVLAVFAMSAAAERPIDGYGTDKCLNGFVWRNAAPGDHVCVTPEIRARVVQQNADAAKYTTGEGPYGPDVCVDGFVWRAAFAGDHVCVYPAERDKTLDDNASAQTRLDQVRMTLGLYSSGGARRFMVRADRMNAGLAVVILFRIDGKALKAWRSLASPDAAKGPGGFLSLRTGKVQCPGRANSYFKVQDGTTGVWSNPYYVSTGCSTL